RLLPGGDPHRARHPTLCPAPARPGGGWHAMTSAHAFSATGIDGREVALAEYAGKVLLIVNVASRCGFTPQYTGLQQLWRDYRERGLVVLGFPCDQFVHQEPGDEAAILQFCTLDYGVDFPMFAKVEVNGAGAHPLWAWLKREKGGLDRKSV